MSLPPLSLPAREAMLDCPVRAAEKARYPPARVIFVLQTEMPDDQAVIVQPRALLRDALWPYYVNLHIRSQRTGIQVYLTCHEFRRQYTRSKASQKRCHCKAV